jgi:hypothetical protein
MLKIVASAEREDPRQEGHKPSHRFRFDERVPGSWVTPFAFVGALLFDSSASAEHRLYPESHQCRTLSTLQNRSQF